MVFLKKEKDVLWQLRQEPLFKDLIKALIKSNRTEADIKAVAELSMKLQQKGYDDIQIGVAIEQEQKRY